MPCETGKETRPQFRLEFRDFATALIGAGWCDMNSETGATVATGAAPAGPINPAALTVAQAARMLGVAEEKVRDHVAAGLPTGSGGTINVVVYAAWLNRELKSDDAD